jgi:hypothetical protein
MVGMDPFELLTLASEFPAAFVWSYDGPCRVEHGAKHWERQIEAAWTDSGAGMVEDTDRSIWEVGMQAEYGVRIPTMSAAGSDGSWNTPWVHPYTRDEPRTKLLWREMWHRTSTADVAATVMVFEDPPSIVFPDHLPIVKGVFGRSTGENGLRSRVFGREALLRPTKLGSKPMLAVAYEGQPLDSQQSVSILTVLSLIFGRDLDCAAEISVDVDGKEVSRHLYAARKHCERAPRPALMCVDARTVSALGMRFDAMVENARQLRFNRDAPMDSAVITLFACNGSRLDYEMRDIVLALDTMVESSAFTPKEGRLVDDFAPIVEHLEAAIEALPDDVPEALRLRLRERIAEANQTSMSARRARFWSAVGFKPTPEESAALRRRHTMSHKGFIDTDDVAAERALFLDVRRARTLVNEALLALLGYDGPVADYVKGPTRQIRTSNEPRE